MGTSGRPSISKRQKEQVRQERARDKVVKKQQKKVDKANGVVPEWENETPEGGGEQAPSIDPSVVTPPR